ncbi:MAG TPA: hypothetical protein VFU82_00190 [Gammaproteobacteria bacterium]|jgi:hypothetical protein|nr:hypothetical protein [Gammaproteobacteria bacterium]
MNLLKKIAALGCALTLFGCASTQSLDPSTDLHQGYYTGKIGRQANLGSFKVRVPQPLRDEPPEVMRLNLETGSDYTQFNAGPTFLNPSMFTARVELKSSPNTSYQLQSLLNQQARSVKILLKKKVTVNGHPASYTVFASPQQEDTSTDGNVTNVHITPALTDGVYLVDYGKYNVIFWITAGADLYSSKAANTALQNQMINGTWGPEVAFVNSFKLYQ